MMINKIWYSFSPLYLLIPFSLLYGLVTAIIRFSYKYGWRKIHKFPIPIVVIGNLTVGGSGKTPIVLWLVKKLQNRGWKVGVVSRGYGGKSKRYPLLLNSTISSEQCGDEPLLIWQKTGAPVAVSPRRTEAVKELLKNQKLDIVVTDDGLQHYALNRDIEWVIVDGERRFGNGWWIPAGPMRERINRLQEVQAVIVNGGKARSGEILMHLDAGKAVNLLTGEKCSLTDFTSVVVMAGIGHPDRFFSMVRNGGVIPIREIVFNDHQVYQKKMLSILTMLDEQLLMTEKDAVKCKSFAEENWWYLPVDVRLSKNSEKRLINSIEKVIRNYQMISEK